MVRIALSVCQSFAVETHVLFFFNYFFVEFKVGIFGEGIYLSDDLSVTMPYTKSGMVWSHSQIGEQISCVALCELIDHPGVKCQVENDTSKKRSMAKDSQSGEVPERYFVVTRSELVRIKYILVFADRKPKQK